jgi:acyl-[acyl-carrier-protein]-phospholipid O-acyltransferase / long-chain-fatty-acid--[acyl-carrier-protein] ligase
MSHYHIIGQDRIPTGSMLVIPGRISRAEITVFRKLFSGRPITWLVEENAVIADDIKPLIQQDQGAMFALDDDPTLVGEQLKTYFAKSGVIIYLPGRTVARAAVPCHIPAKILRALCGFGLPLLPVAIDVPREGGFVIEKSTSQPEGVMSFAPLIDAGKATVPLYQERLLLAAEEAFSQRNFLKQTLGMVLLKGLKKFSSQAKIHDGTDDSELGFDKVLASAIVLSKVIRRETDQPRVGIVLPPGKAGLIANLAVIFAGKVPVNLNFTASQEAVRSAMRQADLDRFITVDPFVRKFPSFPWPPNRDLILIERILPSLKKKIGWWLVLSKILPTALLASHLRLTQKKPTDEAVLLFTSGSSGEPKGVSLTHRNVLANELQFHSRLDSKPGAKIFGCLPLFHSFGCTATLWYPVIAGLDLVTYPSPAESKRIAELIHQQKVEIFLSTPTFLRGYMKRIDTEQLASLKLVVTGAEKLPESFAQAFEEKFGIRPHEGYGLTETSPATNLNLPDLPTPQAWPVIPSARSGSVGAMLPGIAVRITNPATEQSTPIDQQGLIWLKGANVFGGYLNNPKKSAEVLQDGWFLTGDVGRMDADGFLYIEGRISRFSKIGGEMVPHETLEAEVSKALLLDQESERKIAIVGVPDAQKGEAIVLLSTVAGLALEQECIDLRYKLMDAGIPSLWCPKRIVPVQEIPILASGKLDIKTCEDLAKAP